MMDDPRDPHHTATAILDRIALETALEQLAPADRAVMELLYAYRCPAGYTGWWPATAAEVGVYLGATFPEFNGRPPCARTVWRRHAAILAAWETARDGQRRGGEQ